MNKLKINFFLYIYKQRNEKYLQTDIEHQKSISDSSQLLGKLLFKLKAILTSIHCLIIIPILSHILRSKFFKTLFYSHPKERLQ